MCTYILYLDRRNRPGWFECWAVLFSRCLVQDALNALLVSGYLLSLLFPVRSKLREALQKQQQNEEKKKKKDGACLCVCVCVCEGINVKYVRRLATCSN